MKASLSRCAAVHTSGPAKPVPRCSLRNASLAVHAIYLVEIFYAIP